MISRFGGAALAVLISVLPACAEEALSEARGNWAGPGNQGFFYRAVLSQEGEALRLRIWQALSEAEVEANLQFDNPEIAWAPAGDSARAWIEALPEGGLALNILSFVEGYMYSERLIIASMDGQITAMSFASYNNPLRSAVAPEDAFQCFSEACYSCEADLWNGTALADGEAIQAPPHDFEALNAAYWNGARVFELGFCPAPN
jgi:hypothetical protein